MPEEEAGQQPERPAEPAAVETDLSALRASVARLEGRFEEFREAALQRLEALKRRIDWLIGLLFASWITLIGAIVGLYLKR